MMTGGVFIATCLDGYIARGDGGPSWLMKQDTEGEDHGCDAFMEMVDVVMMRRRTFEMALQQTCNRLEQQPGSGRSSSAAAVQGPAFAVNAEDLPNSTELAILKSMFREHWKLLCKSLPECARCY